MQLRQIFGWKTVVFLSVTYLAVHSSESDSSTVFTELSLADLLNMEVTTTSKQAEKLSDAPGVISVITHDEMERFGARTLKDVLLRVPSIAPVTIYMTDRSSVAARGDQLNAAACHTLLLINGRPVREAEEGGIKSEIFESFPVSVIDHLEVIRGPGSVLYGSNAFSAVINIITKADSENKTNLIVYGGYPAAFLGTGSAAYQLGKFSIVAGVKYYNEKEWKLDYAGKNGSTRYHVSIPNTGVGSYLELNYKNLKIMTSYNDWTHFYAIQKILIDSTSNSYGDVFYQKWFNDIGYTQKVSDWWNMSFNATYTQSWLDARAYPTLERNSFDLTGEWTNFFKPVDNLNIVFGMLGNLVNGDQQLASSLVLDTSRLCLGIYLQGNYRLFSSLKIIGGLQGNIVPGFDFDLNPRLGFIWSPVDVVNVKTLYSQAFRAPTIQELHLKGIGIPDLDPEKVHTVDFGINIQTDNASIGLNNFYSRISNTIIQVPTIPMKYANSDQKTTIIGMELEGKYYLTKELLLIGSGLYQRNTNGDSLGNMMPVPEVGGKIGLSYSSNGFTLSAFDIYEGDIDKRYTSVGNPNPGEYNLLNVNFAYDFNKLLKVKTMDQIVLRFDCYNLLDKDVWLPACGTVKYCSLPFIQGRSILFGIDATF
ncbi:MAG TPA: TonB-dependent receptor [Chitinispirillaceae bacterium]|nr:TonB-dependent receptor [Chitinispirillaceae bacterium]